MRLLRAKPAAAASATADAHLAECTTLLQGARNIVIESSREDAYVRLNCGQHLHGVIFRSRRDVTMSNYGAGLGSLPGVAKRYRLAAAIKGINLQSGPSTSLRRTGSRVL